MSGCGHAKRALAREWRREGLFSCMVASFLPSSLPLSLLESYPKLTLARLAQKVVIDPVKGKSSVAAWRPLSRHSVSFTDL